MLYQQQGNQKKVIGYAGRGLSKPERRYPPADKPRIFSPLSGQYVRNLTTNYIIGKKVYCKNGQQSFDLHTNDS